MENHFSRYSKTTLSVLVIILSVSLSLTTVYGQAFQGHGSLKERLAQRGIDLTQFREHVREVMQVQNRHKDMLLEKSGVVGTGTGISPEGEPVIKVFTSRSGIVGIPESLEGVRVKTKVTGKFYALRGDTCDPSCDPTSDPSCDDPCDSTKRWPLPVPIGVSIGHPAITAGTFGARVTDGTDVFVLSNNHVLANVNQAVLGDPILQPGSYDGGVNDDDAVANLTDFEPINFCRLFWGIWLICDQGTNTIDAAIAISTTAEIGFETPTGQDGSLLGYGAPSSIIHAAYGNPNVIGDEDLDQLLGQSVQKFGRTTGNTVGTVDSINATVNVCYDDACSKVARFVDQIIITPGSFSGGGDSGSLIVTQDSNPAENAKPVGLLFAGSDTNTIANRIDLVLNRFGVSVDGGGIDQVADVALTSVSAPASVVQGAAVDVQVTVENTGNQDVDDTFQVTLRDLTDGSDIGTQLVPGLAAGVPTTLTYSWDTTNASTGSHTLEASYDLVDDDIGNNSNDTAVNVVLSLTDIAITAISAPLPVIEGETVNVDVSVNNVGNQVIDDTFQVTLRDLTDGSDIGTQLVPGLAAGASTTLTYSWDTTNASTGSHTLEASHGLVDQNDTNDAETADIEVKASIPLGGPQLQTLTVTASTNSWTTVTLDRDYGDEMVVVCSPNYDRSATGPAVVRVRNASGNSFEVGLGRPWYGALPGDHWSTDVHCMVVQTGEYTQTDHGVKMEAVRLENFTSKDNSGSWSGEPQSYAHAYTNPVVVGQVVSNSAAIPGEIGDWSVFWSRGAKATSPPSSSNLYVGRHTGQDPNGRPSETLMYLAIEAGTGEIEGHKYVAGLGSDTIRGMGNNPPFTYGLSGLSSASTAIVSQAGMDGGDGGWPVLYGSSPVSATQLRLAIEEDWYWDSERNHTTEQVAYIVFE